MTVDGEALAQVRKRVLGGGAERYHAANAAKGKLFARERIALLTDDGSFVEDGLYANSLAEGLPADGVITGNARIDGREVCVMANDSTVKAGSWGARTVEKIIRIIERAYTYGVPMIYLVDSAGARITDQVDLFPGPRGAGKIFHTQVKASGSIPQVCALFGPSAAGGAYIPAFCDVVAMVDGNASMYLGSDRMVEMVTGEKTTLEAMGGARVHCAESGVGHFLCKTEQDALTVVRDYLSYLPANWQQNPPAAQPKEPATVDLAALVPASERQAFDMRRYIKGIVDQGSFFEIHALWAKELTVGFGRLNGEVVGVLGNNSMFKGGVLFVDSADKASRFVQLCDAFNVPLLFLSDVPGFMVGSAVEKQGIIRHGAKMISAISEATVPKICVVVRKAYGAGLYAMAGPGFEPDATLALPTAKIAVMGAEAAVNAVYANKIAALDEVDRPAFIAERRAEYEQDIDIMRLASELVIDAIVEPADLRGELIRRYAAARGKDRSFSRRRHGVTPSESSPLEKRIVMVDFRLSEEQEALRASVQEFAREQVAPVIADHYEKHTFPYDLIRQMGKMGLFGLPFGEEHGGMGGDYFALCLALEELARVDSSVAITLEAAVSLGAMPIFRFGTPEQKATWLPRLTSGEALASFGLTEPGTGSDAAGTTTRAVLDESTDEWVINGSKAFITNSGTDITCLVTVMAVTGVNPDGSKELSAIIVPSGTPGFTVAPGYSKVGWCASDTHELAFDDVRVPAANLLGRRGRGFAQFLQILDEGRIAIAALSVGLAQGCVDESVAYANQRQAFGQTIGRYQAVQFMIADMDLRAHTARLAYYDAAARMLAGQEFKRHAAIAKLHASNAAMDNARYATQVHGGYGFMNESAVGRFYRDAKILEIGEGTSEVQRMLIARGLGL